MAYKVFDSIINRIIEHIDISKDIEILHRICIKQGFYKLFDNINITTKQLVYNCAIESIIHYFHYLKKNNNINGVNHKVRMKEFISLFEKNSEVEKMFLQYPLLESLLYIRVKDALKLQKEIIEKYVADEENIKEKFSISGKIVFIQYSMGDIHDGKSVCTIEFEIGKLIYKPRHAFIDIMYQEIVSMVTDSKISMKEIKTITGQDYSWHEYIEYKECDTLEEVHNFYYRAGIHLAIFFTLGSSDLHYENLIVSGENPMFIDLETIMHGVISKETITYNFRGVQDSVITTGLLPFETDESIFDFSISGLFTHVMKSKKIKQFVLQEDNENDWLYETRYAMLTPKNNLVKYHGKVIKPKSVEKDIVNGFTNTINSIIEKKDSLINILKKYSLQKIMIRQLLRPTHVYYKFITTCEHPEILKSEQKRDNIFDIFLNNFEAGNYGYLRVQEEILDMKKGYIPCFYAFMNQHHLYTNGNVVVCENYFDLSPIEIAIKKIKSLDSVTIENQVRYIQMSLASLNPTSNLIQGVKIKEYNTYLNEDMVKDELLYYNRYLVNQCVEMADGNSYINLLIPNEKKLSICPFSYDLYYSLGIIWMMFEYARIYNSDYDIYAKKMLDCVIEKYKSNINNDAKINYSLFSGIGGLIYIIYNVNKRSKKLYYKEIFDLAVKNTMNYYLTKELDKNDLDYISGFTGTLYLLQKIFISDGSMIDKTKLLLLETKFLNLLIQENKKLNVIGMAHGISGICLPLSNIIIKNEKHFDLLLELLNKENLYIRKQKLKFTWCRGYSGLILARDIIMKKLSSFKINKGIFFGSLPAINDEIIIKNMLSLKNMSLCHGTYGNIDVLLHFIDKSACSHLYLKKFEHLKEIRYIKNTDYSWDNFMLGNSGVAYILMRLFNDVPSILSLDLVDEKEGT